ncbi:MAG TPA: OmpA family protein [Burkholderiales bacterium]
MKKLSLLAAAALLAAGCATQEPQEPAPQPAPAPAPTPTPAPQPAPAPAQPPAARPEPKPAPKPAPKPVAEKVTFATDVLFDFDRADLKPEGRSKLDDLASRVRGINLEVVIAIGYADRIGSTAYNQRLSVRRAEAIKSYLVSRGIEANRVYTEGKGESNPVTGDKCRNMGRDHRSNKKLVECLAPDRRTEIEVIGTRR